MAPWISKIWEYVKIDFEMAQLVPGLIGMDVMIRVMGDKKFYSYEDARRLQKQQFSAQKYRAMMDVPDGYSPERMLEIFRERTRYVIERGSTLNNPHIPASYFAAWPAITKDHAVVLRDQVKTWLSSVPATEIGPSDIP